MNKTSNINSSQNQDQKTQSQNFIDKNTFLDDKNVQNHFYYSGNFSETQNKQNSKEDIKKIMKVFEDNIKKNKEKDNPENIQMFDKLIRQNNEYL